MPGRPGCRLSVCLNRSRCLFDPTARRLLQSIGIGADGRFAFVTTDESILNSLLLLESDVASGFVYRSVILGPGSAGATIDGLTVDPISEAVARILVQNGVDLFSDLSISELIAIVRNALASLGFGGLSPQAAADQAASAAEQSDAIQDAIESRRFTPTPSPSATSTATATLTATIANTVTLTPTASSTGTASLTPTPSATLTVTATQSATPTITNTVPPTATPTLTLTATPTSSPTATLPPLNFAIEVNPDPVRPGETAEAAFTITNTGASFLGPVNLRMTLPNEIEPFIDTLASGTGRCGPNQLQICNPGSTLVWNFIGSLNPGEGITLRVPPIIAAGTPNGTQITFTGTVEVAGLMQTASYTAAVQSGMDCPSISP